MAETVEKMETMIWNVVHAIRGLHRDGAHLHGEAICVDGVRIGPNISLLVTLPRRQERDEVIDALETQLARKGTVASQKSQAGTWTIEATIPLSTS